MPLEYRLENWGCCQRDGWHRGHCRSAEHHYLPERIVGEAWESKQTPRPVLDRADAQLVEVAWRHVHDRRSQTLLKIVYVWRASPQFACRRLAITNNRTNTGYLLALGKAQRAISRALEPKILGCTIESSQHLAL